MPEHTTTPTADVVTVWTREQNAYGNLPEAIPAARNRDVSAVTAECRIRNVAGCDAGERHDGHLRVRCNRDESFPPPQGSINTVARPTDSYRPRKHCPTQQRRLSLSLPAYFGATFRANGAQNGARAESVCCGTTGCRRFQPLTIEVCT
jgi:hypothetical protein